MANNVKQQLQYVITGDPATVNSVTALVPGQLGRYLTVKHPTGSIPTSPTDPNGTDKEFRYIRTDSGASGVAPAAGVPAFWKDKSKYIVTTDLAASGGAGQIAGGYVGPLTRGNFGFIQTGGLYNANFAAAPTANPGVAGNFIVASTTDQGKFNAIAAGTASTLVPFGRGKGPFKADQTAVIDLFVPEVV